MKRILLVSHSHFATGTKNAIELLLGKQDNLFAIAAYEDNSDIELVLNDFMDNSNYEQTLVLTDLFGGSVNTFVSKYLSESVFVVAGYNLALVLDLLLKEEPFSNESIRASIQQAQNAIKFMNDEVSKNEQENTFF